MDSLLHKLTPPIHTSLSTSLNILSLILISLLASRFLNQKQVPHFVVLLCVFVIFIIFKTCMGSTSSEIYLVDYSCLSPPNFWRVPFSSYIEHARIMLSLDRETLDFISKVLMSSGQSEMTYLPPALHFISPTPTYEEAIAEARLLFFEVFEDLLSKTQISPLDIDIIMVNCSRFCPSPSLTSIIINKYSMREDIKSFNISGMGCSASALAVDMAQNLLKVHKNSNAVILSTEILSTGWYAGKNPAMMVLNCIFRSGSAAILITNKKSAKKNSNKINE